jgi:hypothetical protein
LYDAAVVLAERVQDVRMTRHGVAELQGFLFPSGHVLPITPSVGRDMIARGDFHMMNPRLRHSVKVLLSTAFTK